MNAKSLKYFFVLLPVLAVSACASSPQLPETWNVVTPDETVSSGEWIREELAREVAQKTLRVTENASYHLIRLKTAERPHFHEFHDLTVFVLKGKARMHLKDRVVEVSKGDVIEIPKGTPHWAENLLPEDAGEVYAIFTPSYDGKDMHLTYEEE